MIDFGDIDLADVDWAVLVAAAIVGYLVGSVNPAAIIARLRGIDLRSAGSGNPGATNVARTMGGRWGVLVGVLDVLKGLLPALVFGRFGLGAAEVAGLAAVLGHITSPFLRGRGGKGVATTLGALLGVQPLWVVYVLVGFLVGFALFRRIGIGAAFGAVVLIALGLAAPALDGKLFGIGLGALVLVRHGRNIAAAWQELRGGDGTAGQDSAGDGKAGEDSAGAGESTPGPPQA